MEKEAQTCVEAMLDFDMWSFDREAAWPGSSYPDTDTTIGIGTTVHEYLMRIGYVDKDGNESGFTTIIPPREAFQSYCHAQIGMYETYCSETRPSPSPMFDAKPGSDVTSTRDYISIDGPGGIHYSGDPVTVRVDIRGEARFESEFELEIKEDDTIVIDLVEGYGTYYNFEDNTATEITSAQRLMVSSEGKTSPPTQLDVDAMDRWWEVTATGDFDGDGFCTELGLVKK